MLTRRKTKYDEEPVSYCGRCLSLAVVEEDGVVYCSKCGCSRDIKEAPIEEWEELYKEKMRREDKSF